MPDYTSLAYAGSNNARQRIAMAMLQNGVEPSPVQSWSQGAARVVNALVGGMAQRKQEQGGEDAVMPVAATRLWNRDGGRSFFDGPTNGNWGGKYWSGGRYAPPGSPNGLLPPVDSGDELYMKHDLCWGKVGDDQEGKRACDRELIDGLNALPLSPKDWPKPPPPGTEDDTNWFREKAINRFAPPPPEDDTDLYRRATPWIGS